jgi:hypothetical protein
VGQAQLLPLFMYGDRQSKSHNPSPLQLVVPLVMVLHGVQSVDW